MSDLDIRVDVLVIELRKVLRSSSPLQNLKQFLHALETKAYNRAVCDVVQTLTKNPCAFPIISNIIAIRLNNKNTEPPPLSPSK